MTNSSRPPPTKVEIEPGDNPWLALAREVAQRPDGPVALGVMSHINKTMRPREKAVERLLEALARDIEAPGTSTLSEEIAAARAHWEAVCQTCLTDDLMADFQQDAAKLVERRKRQPPEMSSILTHGAGDRRDFGYELGGDLSELQGTWHRLWASISMTRLFGTQDHGELAPDLRSEFEGLLGRTMTVEEWDQLVAHAHHHCDTVMRPRFGDSPIEHPQG